MSSSARRWAGALLLSLGLTAPATARDPAPVTIYAAASLSGALSQLWPPQRHPEVRLSFAASSVLARQIEAGAPADLFISAHPAWMDSLQAHGRIEPTSRQDLLGNHLVLVVSGSTDWAAIESGAALAQRLDSARSRLAVADPDHVPAGIYARQALQALGWWSALSSRLAPAADARAALALVERDACAAGIVYASDAHSSRRVRRLLALPDSLHDAIRYPAALVRDGPSTAGARQYLDTLRSAAARASFADHGFDLLPVTD